MKGNQVLLVLLLLVVSQCDTIQTEAKNTYPPTSCSPLLMNGLANPTSLIPDNYAFQTLFEAIRNSTNSTQILYELTKYTPRFVGLFLTYIQQIRLLKKKIEAADPQTRTLCLTGFQAKQCSQVCTADIVVTPEFKPDCNPEVEGCDNFIVPDNEECIKDETLGHILLREAYSSPIELIDQDQDSSCPSEYSSVNSFFEDECYDVFQDSQMTCIGEPEYDSQQTGVESSCIFSDDYFVDYATFEPQEMSRRRNYERLRLMAINQFGRNVLEDQSFRCIDASYLLQENL